MLPKNSFFIRSFSLTFLTGLSQVLAFLYFAFIANILLQEELGRYVSLMAAVEIFSPLILFSLEKNLPNLEKKSFNAYFLILLFFSFLSSSIIGLSISIFFHINFLIIFLYCVINGLLRLIEYTNIRNGRMQLVGLVKVTQFVTIFLILFSLIYIFKISDLSFSSLFSIFVFAYLINLVWYALFSLKGINFKEANLKIGFVQIKENLKFITFVTPSDFFNKAALNSPLIFIGIFFGQSFAAQYALINKLIMSPLGLIVTAVGQIFHSDFAQLNRELAFREAKKIFMKLNQFLIIISISFGIVIFISFDFIIDYFFGPGWDLSKELFIYLFPLFITMIFVSPMASSMFVVKDFLGLFYSQLSLLVISLLAFLVMPQFFPLQIAVLTYSVLSIIRLLFLYLRIVKNFNKLEASSF